MNKQYLLDLRTKVESRFNDTQVELHKIQGEYRVLDDLIDNFPASEGVAVPETAPENENK